MAFHLLNTELAHSASSPEVISGTSSSAFISPKVLSELGLTIPTSNSFKIGSSLQIGKSTTANQNFTLAVPDSPNGTIKLARGNSGATTADILSVDSSNNVSFSAGISAIINSATINSATINSSTINGGAITLATAQNATGTNVDFTGIPNWVKRIAVMFNGVSTNGNNALEVKLGTSSGLESTGYVGTVGGLLPTSSNAQSMGTTGFDTYSNAAAALNIGQMVITTVGSNVWIASYNISNFGATYLINVGNGNKTLSGTLDRVRITTTSGTDTFDAGSINIMYEG